MGLGVRYILLLASCLSANEASAAKIAIYPLNQDGRAVVSVDGEMEFEDAEQFRQKTAALNEAIIAFDSPGGSAIAGIEIGTTIRMKGFKTWVSDGSVCASACALAWLGGSKRLVGTSAKVGFHAVFNKDTGAETGTGNALVGAYMARIGLPDRAIFYITQASPKSMTWLNFEDAEAYGIPVENFSPPSKSAKDPEPRRQASAASPSTLSVDDYAEARRLANNFEKRYKDAGMVGLNGSIDACYDRLALIRTEALLRYCLMLDALALRIDSAADSAITKQKRKEGAEAVMRRHKQGLTTMAWTFNAARFDHWMAITNAAETMLAELSKAR
ncbi:MAG: Periplasmic protein-like protein [Hyphomicrobiales bacterium]|nr:Periplasmic protein-like protein [Hyphomicrobiales bacterium]